MKATKPNTRQSRRIWDQHMNLNIRWKLSQTAGTMNCRVCRGWWDTDSSDSSMCLTVKGEPSSSKPAGLTVSFYLHTHFCPHRRDSANQTHACVCLTCFSPSILLSASCTASRYLKCSSMSLSTCSGRENESGWASYTCTENLHTHTTCAHFNTKSKRWRATHQTRSCDFI